MKREPVESSSIAGVGYAPESQVLEVEFVSGGTYQYMDVLPHEYAALMAASSKGRHVNAHIKSRFVYRRVPR